MGTPAAGTPAPGAPTAGGPVRTCVGCRARRPQTDLLRLVVTERGQVVVGRRSPGRGAWLCRATPDECLVSARKRRSLGRALRVDLAADAYEALCIALIARAKINGNAPGGPKPRGTDDQ